MEVLNLRSSLIHAALFLLASVVCPPWGFADSKATKPEKTKEEVVKAKLQDITVVGSIPISAVTPVSTRYASQYNLVTEEEIKDGNVYDFPSSLRNVPGVMFQSKNLMGGQTSHSLYIRGRGASHPSADFAIEFDGVPRYGALFGQVLGDGIALPTIGGIEVFKNPQPAQFGNGYASVNILPRYMKEEGKMAGLDAGAGSYATFSQSLYGGLKKGPFDFYLSQSWTSTDGHVDHSRAQQQSYYANAGYQINESWSVRFLANYAAAQTLASRPDEIPTSVNGVSWPGAERYDTETTFAVLSLNNAYNAAGGYLKAYLNDTTFDLLQELTNGNRYGGGTRGLKSRQEVSLHGVRAKEKITAWKGGELLIGADFDMAELKNTQRTYSGAAVAGINGDLAERAWNFPDTTLLSPYLAVSQMMGRSEDFHFVPSASVRYFAHDTFEDKMAAQAGFTMGYGPTELTLNYARGINYPTPVVVMNLVAPGSTVTDPSIYWSKIKPEVVDHYEASLTHTWPAKASVGITAFDDEGKDRFQAYMFGPIPALFNDPIGKYRIRGLELTGTIKPLKTLEIFGAAAWLDSEAKGNNGVEQSRLPYTPSFQLQAGMKWTILQHVQLYFDLQHLEDVYGGTNVRSGTFNYTAVPDSSELPDATLLNGRLSYQLGDRRFGLKDAEIFIAVNNILDENYEWARGYSMPGTTVFGGFSMKL